MRQRSTKRQTADDNSAVSITIKIQSTIKPVLVATSIKQATFINPTAPRKAKIVYNFGLSECNRVKQAYMQFLKQAKNIEMYLY